MLDKENMQNKIKNGKSINKQLNEQLKFLNTTAHHISTQSDCEEAIRITLKDILNYFQSQRSYIVEIDYENQTTNNTYEICAEGIQSEKRNLKDISFSKKELWYRKLFADKCLCIEDVDKLNGEDKELREMLEAQGIKSIYLISIWRKNTFTGFIGVDNPKAPRDRMVQLTALSDYISVLLGRRDLTQRVQRDLLEMNQFINDTPGGFLRLKIVSNMVLNIVNVNEGFCKMLGMSREEVMEAYGQDALSCVVTEDITKITEENMPVFENKEKFSGRCRLYRKNGTLLWVMVFGRFISSESGEVYLNSFFTDISEEIEKEEFQIELLDNLPCGAGLFYSDGKVIKTIHVNNSYKSMVGKDLNTTEHRNVFEVVHPDDQKIVSELIKGGMEGKIDKNDCELRMCHVDGTYHPYKISYKATKVENEKYIIYITFNPIPEDHLTMQQMVPYLFPAMMKSSTDITFVKDRDFRYLCCSNASARILGYKNESEIVGKTDEDLFPTDVAEKIREEEMILIKNGKPVIDKVESVQANNGLPYYTRISKYALHDKMGNVIAIYGIGRDITEGKQTSNQLKLFKNSIPSGLATCVVSSKKQSLVYYNDRLAEELGFYDKSKKLTINDLLSTVHENDIEILLSKLKMLIRDHTDINLVYRVYGDGNVRKRIKWVNLKAIIADKMKEDLVVNAVFLDVTKQQEEKERLRLSEESNRQHYEREMQLRTEMIKEAMSYYQLNLSKMEVEEYHSIYPNWQKIHSGDVVNKQLNRKIMDGIAKEDRDLVKSNLFPQALFKAYQEGRTSLSIVFRSLIPEYGMKWTLATVTILQRFNSGDIIALIFNKDIDMQKKDQLAIGTIMDEEIESVTVVTVNTGIAHFAQLASDSKEEKLDEDFEYKQVYYHMLHHSVFEEDQKACEAFYSLDNLVERLKKEAVIKHIFRLRTEEGTILRKKVRAFYLDSTHREIIIIRRDITDLYEEEQRQKRELQQAVDDANRANQAKSEFLSRMSHDMRTPLNAILSFSGEELLRDSSEEQHLEFLKKIHFSGDYLLGIINDVLDMSKIEQNKMTLHCTPYSADSFVELINDVIKENCKKKQIKFVMDFGDISSKWIFVDQTRFNQIFINLLSNAMKFTNKGGQIEFHSKSLSVSGEGIDQREFIIKDNGIGMSANFIPYAFESFSQEAETKTAENNQGTGLGLSIVKKLVHLMNGTIEVESEQGKGTAFTLVLPLQMIDDPKLKSKAKEESKSLEGIHVLLCEDNEINIEIVKLLLERQGCKVDCAENGKIGLALFRKSNRGDYQIILMDGRMPIMDGYEATQRIRRSRHPDAKTIPIIALTADAFTEDTIVSENAGMNAHLSKPVNAKVLFQTMRELL